MKPFLQLILFIALLQGCKKKDAPTVEPEPEPVPADTVKPTSKPGPLAFEFYNMAGSSALQFGQNYVTPKGDTFYVTKLAYYISNIELRKTDGSVYKVPESYQIIRHPAPRSFTVNDVPPGKYESVRYMVGVDSTRNTSGSQTGGLDVAYASDMYWSWSTGYIFFKLEGKSPASGSASKSITYHIGGFEGVNKAQRWVTIQLPVPVTINSTEDPSITVYADVVRFFGTPNVLDLSTHYYQMSAGAGTKSYADNYAAMFGFGSLRQ
jgi:hypothetical protein